MMDAETDRAIEALTKTCAGTAFALAAFAEALVKERVIQPDRLIEHLDKPSDELIVSGAEPEQMAVLNALIGLLRLAYGPISGSPPRAN